MRGHAPRPSKVLSHGDVYFKCRGRESPNPELWSDVKRPSKFTDFKMEMGPQPVCLVTKRLNVPKPFEMLSKQFRDG